jgi:SNF family Na+-dependent transporter
MVVLVPEQCCLRRHIADGCRSDLMQNNMQAGNYTISRLTFLLCLLAAATSSSCSCLQHKASYLTVQCKECRTTQVVPRC